MSVGAWARSQFGLHVSKGARGKSPYASVYQRAGLAPPGAKPPTAQNLSGKAKDATDRAWHASTQHTDGHLGVQATADVHREAEKAHLAAAQAHDVAKNVGKSNNYTVGDHLSKAAQHATQVARTTGAPADHAHAAEAHDKAGAHDRLKDVRRDDTAHRNAASDHRDRAANGGEKSAPKSSWTSSLVTGEKERADARGSQTSFSFGGSDEYSRDDQGRFANK